MLLWPRIIAILSAPSAAQSPTVLVRLDARTALLEAVDWDRPRPANHTPPPSIFAVRWATEPSDARLRLGAGMATYLERRDADARTGLEHALRLDSADRVPRARRPGPASSG